LPVTGRGQWKLGVPQAWQCFAATSLISSTTPPNSFLLRDIGHLAPQGSENDAIMHSESSAQETRRSIRGRVSDSYSSCPASHSAWLNGSHRGQHWPGRMTPRVPEGHSEHFF